MLIDMTTGDKDPYPCQEPNPEEAGLVCGLDYEHPETVPHGAWWRPTNWKEGRSDDGSD